MKPITNKVELDKILSLKEGDITKTLIMDFFGDFNGKRKYSPDDEIIVPPGTFGNKLKNKTAFPTTIGIYLFNKLFIENDLIPLLGYYNETIDNGIFKGINKKISYGVMEDDIGLDTLKRFLMKSQFLMRFVSILTPNYTEKILDVSLYLEKKKNKLIEDNKEKLAKGDVATMEKIEQELIQDAQDFLMDDESMDQFISGAKADIKNNFKNMFIIKGAIPDVDPDKGYSIATSNYIDGISKEEFPLFADSLVGGAYYKSKNTANGGYWVKLFIMALQHITLNSDPNSDCGTKRYITVTFDEKNIEEEYMYSYVIEGNKLVEITSKNYKNYIGKTCKLRYSSLCESKTSNGICNKCAGNLFNRMGIKNVGMITPKIPSTVMMFSMKKFHDSTVKTSYIDKTKVF